jgi:hypothetical protein
MKFYGIEGVFLSLFGGYIFGWGCSLIDTAVLPLLALELIFYG